MRVVTLLLLLLALPATADTIWLKNGDRLTGEVTPGEESLTLSFPFGGEVEIPRTAVKRWRAKQAPSPVLSKKGIDLALLRPDEEKWHLSGSSDVSLKIKQNSSRTNNLSVKGKLEMEDPSWRTGLEGEYDYDTSNSTTTDHNYRLQPKVDYFLADRWYWRTTVDYQYDMLDDNYLNVDYNSGAGYRFWKQKRKRLEFLLLGGLRDSYFDSNELIQFFFNTQHVSYPTATLGWDYQQRIGDSQLELFSEGKYIYYLSQPSDYVTYERTIDGSVGLRYYLSEHLRLSWSSSLTWDDAYIESNGERSAMSDKEWRQTLSLGASF